MKLILPLLILLPAATMAQTPSPEVTYSQACYNEAQELIEFTGGHAGLPADADTQILKQCACQAVQLAAKGQSAKMTQATDTATYNALKTAYVETLEMTAACGKPLISMNAAPAPVARATPAVTSPNIPVGLFNDRKAEDLMAAWQGKSMSLTMESPSPFPGDPVRYCIDWKQFTDCNVTGFTKEGKPVTSDRPSACKLQEYIVGSEPNQEAGAVEGSYALTLVLSQPAPTMTLFLADKPTPETTSLSTIKPYAKAQLFPGPGCK